MFNKFCDTETCEIKIAFGYQNIHDVIDILDNSGVKINILGLLDRDFLNVESILPIYTNVFFVDSHDLEMMAFQTKALETVFVNFGDSQKIKDLILQRKKSIRHILLEIIYPLSLLKYVNYKYKIGLSFKPKVVDGPKIKYEFIDHKSFTFIGYEKLIEVVYNFNLGKTVPNLNRVDCLTLVNKYLNQKFDLNLLCNGHDLCRLISISLRRHTGSMGSKAANEEDIEQRLVLAYDSKDFISTAVYKEIKQFEKTRNIRILSI